MQVEVNLRLLQSTVPRGWTQYFRLVVSAAGSPQLYKRLGLHLFLTTGHMARVILDLRPEGLVTGHYNMVTYYTDDKIM